MSRLNTMHPGRLIFSAKEEARHLSNAPHSPKV